MNDAIVQAKQIDEQSKVAGFYQEVLDHVVRQGFANSRFEVNSVESMDLVEEFYIDEASVQNVPEAKTKVKQKLNQEDGFVQDTQQGLQRSISGELNNRASQLIC